MSDSKLLDIVVKTLDEKLAEDIVVIDFREVSPFQDYFVIATARNHRLGAALIDYVEDEAAKAGYVDSHKEGDGDSSWQLLDLKEVVVHVFVGSERQVYSLENLWADLPRVDMGL